MPTPEERERKRLKNSGLASNRILEKDITRAEMGEEGVSATTRNRAIRDAKMDARMAPQREAKAQRLADEIQGISTRAKEQQASFDNSPIGAFQQRMRTGGMGERPLAGMAPSVSVASPAMPQPPSAPPVSGRTNAAALSHLGLDVGPAIQGGALQTLPAGPSTGRGSMQTLPASPSTGRGSLEPLSSMRPQLPSTPEADAALDEYIARERPMQQDYGIGAQPQRDSFAASLPSRQTAATPGVTTLQPSRTTPFSRADAQALAALDPRALNEARSLAAMPESMPAKITGSFGGKSFEMQPSARVDRNALARLYGQAQQRQAQERQDTVRGQEQAGRLALVEAPGRQLTERAKLDNEAKVKIAEMEAELKRPLNEAEIARINAQTEGVQGAERRAAAEAGRMPAAESRATIMALLEGARGDQSPRGRQKVAALEGMLASMAGVAIPQTDSNQNLDAAASIAGADAVMNDPGVEALMKKIEETQQGTLLNSPENRNAQNLHIETLNKRLRALAQAQGVDINEIAPQIKARLSKAINKRSLGQSLGSNPVTSFIDSLLGVQPSAPPAELVGG